MPFIASTRGSFGAQGRFAGAAGAVVATGGITTSSSDGYVIHTFNTNGTFTLTSAPASATFDYLMVAGGGGGGAGNGNNSAHPAGGAGGLIYRTGQTLTAGTYGVVVGTGGAALTSGSYANAQYSGAGTNSTFNGLTAIGGGGGVNGQYNALPGQAGGSGGGAQHADNGTANIGGAALQPGSASGGFGFKGGDGVNSSAGGPCWIGGGGGGAGAAGGNGTNGAGANTNVGGEGGIGRQYSIAGITRYYSGGGGGGTTFNNDSNCLYNPAGGLGGGGRGYGHAASGNFGRHGGEAFGSLGGGGGGATTGNDTYLATGLRGGNGSAGTVIIRYQGAALSAPRNVPGLTAWYDASSASNFTFTTNPNIATWLDIAGGGYHLNATNTPQFVSNAQNGLGVVRFVAASTQYLQNTTLPFYPERTIFIVRKFSLTSGQPVIGFPTRFTDTWRGLYVWATNEYGFNTWNGDSYGTSSFSSTAFQIDTATFRETSPTPFDSTWELRVNGSVKSLSTLRGTHVDRQQYANGLYVSRGGAAGGSQHLQGDIAEILVYDSVLTTTQKETIEAYLTSKWGIV
jgi:hypothetical protein